MELPDRPIKDPYKEIPVKDFSYINTKDKLPKKTDYKLWLIVSGVIILIILAAGAYFYGQHTKTKSPVKTSHTASSQKAAVSKPAAPATQLTSYTSTPFNLTVNYPTTWTVASNGNTSMTITSPIMSLVADSGKTVSGKTVLTVLNQGQIPTAFGTTSVAVLNSLDITFTSPTSSQAAQTYISFVQYPATVTKGGLDAIYVSGNSGYLKGQTIPPSDINKVSPLVIVSFMQCQTTACTSLLPLTISSNMWSSSSFETPILDIIKSFQFS